MKITVTQNDFVNAFQKIRPQNFSPNGLKALFEHLEELESCMGEELELDVIAFCCDFAEYPDAMTAAEDLGFDAEDEDDAFDRLNSETTLIDFDGGIIVENF